MKEKQYLDTSLVRLKKSVKDQKVEVFSQGGDGVLRLQGRLCVPNIVDLRQRIMDEVYGARYSIHPGTPKMYRDLREIYWWSGMKNDIEAFVSKCAICQ